MALHQFTFARKFSSRTTETLQDISSTFEVHFSEQKKIFNKINFVILENNIFNVIIYIIHFQYAKNLKKLIGIF